MTFSTLGTNSNFRFSTGKHASLVDWKLERIPLNFRNKSTVPNVVVSDRIGSVQSRASSATYRSKPLLMTKQGCDQSFANESILIGFVFG